ncbi:pseudouridine synthase [Clostridium sp. SM-530-WT-3G]|uniref:pseudouridine synthase n=1 Tax=Clostridium sp. SM-530-WT-3G TaxID=2725303 RepID=UPI00145F749B|nr:pseudouridine synthase [Clostridium sp. SM-530-WT-3G]NME83454.1 pseudouridine synthase [Clostridium sp. SM-530-WT-3G]
MRINKLFSNYGICSRKDVNKLIDDKRITVNGKECVQGQWVEEDDEILLDGKKISMQERIYIALNKPAGIITTSDKEVKDNIIDFVNYPKYIFPVGRLDKESEGLIILTNDGELANDILEADNNHEKEYIVTLNKEFDDEFINQIRCGVKIPGTKGTGIKRISDTKGVVFDNGVKKIVDLNDAKLKSNNNDGIVTRPCKAERVNENTFKIILTQGLNRQIRKMCKTLGYEVIKLKRIRILNISLDDIDYGKWRYINEEEIQTIKKLVK